MNLQALADALRALAAALETPAQIAPTLTQAAAVTAAPAAASPKRGPGRPPKGVEGAPSTAPVAATPADTAPAAIPLVTLKHADLIPAFKAAALAHGRDFVAGALKAYGAATFDKVPADKLSAFKAHLESGPQAAAPSADGADLLG